MSRKIHKLSVSIEENFCLLGIVTDDPDYKLVWLINEGLRLSFIRKEDLVLFNKVLNVEQQFCIFIHENEHSMLIYRLIGNRGENGYFLGDLKNIDFVLHVQGDIIPEEMEKLVRSLNGIRSVRMCVPVDLRKIRDKERLFLW